jgi:hypothetical protein
MVIRAFEIEIVHESEKVGETDLIFEMFTGSSVSVSDPKVLEG